MGEGKKGAWALGKNEVGVSELLEQETPVQQAAGSSPRSRNGGLAAAAESISLRWGVWVGNAEVEG